MAGDTTITVVGNLTADPELRFTPSGAAVANFTVASTPRIYDRQSGEWKDGEALFLRCNNREQKQRKASASAKPARQLILRISYYCEFVNRRFVRRSCHIKPRSPAVSQFES